MKKFMTLALLAIVCALSAENFLDLHKLNVHTPSKNAKIEKVQIDYEGEKINALKFTAPAFSLLRVDFRGLQDWSKYDSFEFLFKTDITGNRGYGYIYSRPDVKKWGERVEFSTNKATNTPGQLRAGKWYKGNVALKKSAKLCPERMIMLDFGLTKEGMNIPKDQPITFYVAQIRPVNSQKKK